MLDENLPTFYIKPSSNDNPLSHTIYLSQNGSELNPEYTLRRPSSDLPASKNVYAVALYDSYNPEVLFAEVLVRPEWTQPTLSAAEIRAQNGIPPPPVPIVPNSFVIQLYNPDQQVTVRQIAGTWKDSAHWEFEMPQNSFRVPSASSLDRTQDDPAASDLTPRITFKWKRDGKLSKDISCFLAGRTTDSRKNKEPDITVAMFKGGKNLTIYEPNMQRVEVEDQKGLEVVFLLSSTVIKDIFFNANREMFNIGNPTVNTTNTATAAHPRRKNSGPVINGKDKTPPTMTGAVFPNLPVRPVPASQVHNSTTSAQQSYSQPSAPPPPDPRIQWEIDAETERLKKIVQAEEKARERAEKEEQKRIKKMIEQEDKERRKREAEVEKETERLRKLYGVQPTPTVQQPPLPNRPGNNSMPQYQSAPHSVPVPVQRPGSTPGYGFGGFQGTPNPYGPGGTPAMPAPGYGRPAQNNSPYLQAPGSGSGNGNATASSSGFFGTGKKVQKKRSVFF